MASCSTHTFCSHFPHRTDQFLSPFSTPWKSVKVYNYLLLYKLLLLFSLFQWARWSMKSWIWAGESRWVVVPLEMCSKVSGTQRKRGRLWWPSNAQQTWRMRKRYIARGTVITMCTVGPLAVSLAFRCQVKVLSSLRHPNFIRYYGCVKAKPHLYIVTGIIYNMHTLEMSCVIVLCAVCRVCREGLYCRLHQCKEGEAGEGTSLEVGQRDR